MHLELPDFDTLKHLAETDPEALEAIRQEHVTALINNAPLKMRRRLRGLQFQVDAQRKIHQDSPMASCIKISQMMYDSFSQMRCLLNGLQDEATPTPARTTTPPARVLEFRAR